MQSELVPVDELPALLGRLRAARKAKRLTQQEVAEQLGVSRTTLVAIESGNRPLRFQELVDMASLYERSINQLLRPTPVTDDFVARFKASCAQALEDSRVESGVALLQELADDYQEVERVAGATLPRPDHPEAGIRGIDPAEAAESLAASERNRLGLGDGPVLELRKLLEADVGLRIFALDLPVGVAGLYISSPALGACVAMNANHSFERQRWSLAHQFAYFLAHRSQPEVTLRGNRRRTSAKQRFAEAFAENFLMPAAGLKRRFHMMSQARANGPTPTDLHQLADLFQISYEAMARRLKSVGLIRRNAWEDLLDAGALVDAPRWPTPAAQPADTELLPLRFRYLAVEAWTEGEISEGQAARLLRVDRTTARLIAAQLSHRVLEEAGSQGSAGSEPEQELAPISA